MYSGVAGKSRSPAGLLAPGWRIACRSRFWISPCSLWMTCRDASISSACRSRRCSSSLPVALRLCRPSNPMTHAKTGNCASSSRIAESEMEVMGPIGNDRATGPDGGSSGQRDARMPPRAAGAAKPPAALVGAANGLIGSFRKRRRRPLRLPRSCSFGGSSPKRRGPRSAARQASLWNRATLVGRATEPAWPEAAGVGPAGRMG